MFKSLQKLILAGILVFSFSIFSSNQAEAETYTINHYYSNAEVNDVLDNYRGATTATAFVGLIGTYTGYAPIGYASFVAALSLTAPEPFINASRQGTGLRISYDYEITQPSSSTGNEVTNESISYQ